MRQHTLTRTRVAGALAAALTAATLAMTVGTSTATGATEPERMWPATEVARHAVSNVRKIVATSDGAVYSVTNTQLSLTKYLPDGGGRTINLTNLPESGSPGRITRVRDLDVDASDRLYLLVEIANVSGLFVARLTGDAQLEYVPGGNRVLNDARHVQAHLGVSGNGQYIVIGQTVQYDEDPFAPAVLEIFLPGSNTPVVVPKPQSQWDIFRGVDVTNTGEIWALGAQVGGPALLWRLPSGSNRWSSFEASGSRWGNLSISADDVIAYTMKAAGSNGSWTTYRRLPADPRPWTIGTIDDLDPTVLDTSASLNGDIFVHTAYRTVRYTARRVVAPDQALAVTAGGALAIELDAEAGGQPDELTYSIVDEPTHGTLTGTAPNLTYTADAGFSGTDSFTYEAAVMSTTDTGTVTIEVAPATQAITFPQPADLVYNGPDAELGATAPGGEVTYTSNTPEVCTVIENIVHPAGGGECSITAHQDGGSGYLAADPETRTLTVARASQVITFPQPDTVVVDAGFVMLHATSSASYLVSYFTSTPEICVVTRVSVYGLAGGDCIITATQEGDENYEAAEPVTIVVPIEKLEQTITFRQPGNTVYGGADVPLDASASSEDVVSFTSETPAVCTIVNRSARPVGTGTCTITATQAGSRGYHPAAPVTRSLAVAKAAQSVSFTQPGNTVFEGADVALTATATSGLPVTFTSLTPAVCTVVGGKAHPTGAGTCTITAAQAGDGNYLPAAAVTRSLTVAKAPITVTTSSSSSLASLLTLRVNYTSVVKSATTGKPVAGVTVTTRIDGGSPTSGCVGVTDANGVAKCTSGPIGIALLTSYQANAQESANYLSGTGKARTPLL